MPSKIGDKAFYKCTGCRRMYFGHIDIFWTKNENGTWCTTCPECQEKKRRAASKNTKRREPGLPIFQN